MQRRRVTGAPPTRRARSAGCPTNPPSRLLQARRAEKGFPAAQRRTIRQAAMPTSSPESRPKKLDALAAQGRLPRTCPISPGRIEFGRLRFQHPIVKTFRDAWRTRAIARDKTRNRACRVRYAIPCMRSRPTPRRGRRAGRLIVAMLMMRRHEKDFIHCAATSAHQGATRFLASAGGFRRAVPLPPTCRMRSSATSPPKLAVYRKDCVAFDRRHRRIDEGAAGEHAGQLLRRSSRRSR